MYRPQLVSLISAISFGMVDSIIFLLCESSIQIQLNKFSFFDEKMAELVTGGLSAAISMYIAVKIHDKLRHNYTFIVNPIYDVIGVLLGMMIVLMAYYVFMK